MFVRVEGQTRPTATDAWQSFLYHVGFQPAFGSVTTQGAIDMTGASGGPTLSIDVDRMLETNGAPLPAPKHTVPDGWVMDNLETNQAFSLR
jgi:hypothetical protein